MIDTHFGQIEYVRIGDLIFRSAFASLVSTIYSKLSGRPTITIVSKAVSCVRN